MEVFMKLGLKEVANIIKTLGVSTEIPYMHGGMYVNGKLHIYEKKGNTLTIKTEEGKSVSVAVDCSVEEHTDKHGNHYELPKHQVYFEYGLSNGQLLAFSKVLPLDGYYEGFEDVNRHDLLTGTTTSYVDQDGRDVASFSTELTNIQLAKSENTFVFGLNGSEDPIAVKCKNDETSLATGMELPKEARLAKLARKQLQIAVASCAIDANSIDVIGNKFRQDVMLYKEAHPETVR